MAPKRKVARPTILEVLTTPRREPDSSNAKGSRKISENQAWAHTEELEEWTEFTYENLILAFGPILEQDAPDGVYARDFGTVDEAPSKETHIMGLVSKSTMETVKQGANRTAALFPEHHHDVNLDFKKGMNIRNPYYPQWNTRGEAMTDPKGGKWGEPDWIVYSSTPDMSSPSLQEPQSDESIEEANTRGEKVILLVGECKRSEAWTWNECQDSFRKACSTPESRSCAKSAQSNLPQTLDLEPEPEEKNETKRYNMLKPLDQLSTYCFWAKVPFGFLHTEKGLILCNARWISDPDSRDKRPRAGVKYVRVPWRTNREEGTLTPELMLYCIIIAASYRKSYSTSDTYSTSDQYIHEDIITWHRVAGRNNGIAKGKDQGKSKSKRYRNKLSGVVRKERYLREYKHLKLID